MHSDLAVSGKQRRHIDFAWLFLLTLRRCHSKLGANLNRLEPTTDWLANDPLHTWFISIYGLKHIRYLKIGLQRMINSQSVLRSLFKKLKQVRLPVIQHFKSSLSRHLSTDYSAYLLLQQQVVQRNEGLMFHFTYRFREACGSSEIVPGICLLSISLPSTELWSRIAFFFILLTLDLWASANINTSAGSLCYNAPCLKIAPLYLTLNFWAQHFSAEKKDMIFCCWSDLFLNLMVTHSDGLDVSDRRYLSLCCDSSDRLISLSCKKVSAGS